MGGAHGLVYTLAHLQQQQHHVDGRVRPLHQDQLLLHTLHPVAIRDTRSHAQMFHGAVPLQVEQVLGKALCAAVLVVQLDQSFVQVGPQRPQDAGEHGPLQRQV